MNQFTLNVADIIITNMLYYLKNFQRSSPFKFRTKQIMLNYVAMLFVWSHDVSSVNAIQVVRKKIDVTNRCKLFVDCRRLGEYR